MHEHPWRATYKNENRVEKYENDFENGIPSERKCYSQTRNRKQKHGKNIGRVSIRYQSQVYLLLFSIFSFLFFAFLPKGRGTS